MVSARTPKTKGTLRPPKAKAPTATKNVSEQCTHMSTASTPLVRLPFTGGGPGGPVMHTCEVLHVPYVFRPGARGRMARLDLDGRS